MPIHMKRLTTILRPNQTRVLLRSFNPGDTQRERRIVARIASLPEEQIGPILKEVFDEFSQRHHQLSQLFLERYKQLHERLSIIDEFSEQRKLLIGSYFMAEYSLESVALFNPSIVIHPDQSDLPSGALRFILSLRAVGEGHLSSITFRTGIIYADHRIEVHNPTGFVSEPRQIPNPRYEKALFERKMFELHLLNEFTIRVMQSLDDWFELEALDTKIRLELNEAHNLDSRLDYQSTANGVWMAAKSNGEIQFQPHQDLSERVILPTTPSQHNGIEDARFVRFQNDDNTYTYYATFTAFDGRVAMPELMETSDFLSFRFITLNGPAAENKGMALFPRKINGLYAMLSRQDNENIHIMFSDNIHFWNKSGVLLKPAFPSELIQIGNCGSPIETDAGWLVLSHSVGPVRKYGISAFLLDRENPTKVIGRLREPLLTPNRKEREGYVPNVVYTCGALLHNGVLIVPYGMADKSTGFATVSLYEVLAAIHQEDN